MHARLLLTHHVISGVTMATSSGRYSYYIAIWNWFTPVVKYAAPHDTGHAVHELWQPLLTNRAMSKFVAQSQRHC